MRGRRDRYGWAAYYEAAYERERKKNIVLAGKIADAERRLADLDDNLNRIYSNPFWKATSPFRKLYLGIKKGTPNYKDTSENPQENIRLQHYEEELHRQKHPYTEWIKTENNDGYIEGVEHEDNKAYKNITIVAGWKITRIAESDILLLTYGKGALDADAPEKIKSYFNKYKTCKIAYTDEDFYWEDLSCRMQPWFKPCYSPDTLLSFNYWGHLVAVREKFLKDALSDRELIDRKEKIGQSVLYYELCLRLEEAVQKRCMLDGTLLRESICHIDSVLYHQSYEPSEELLTDLDKCTDHEEQFRMVEESLIRELEMGRYLVGAGAQHVPVREAALTRRGLKGSLLSGQEPDIFHIVYDTSMSGRERCVRALSEDRQIPPHHAVSVVIPSRDHPEVLERCLKSFREKTDYMYYEWIVVDNGSNPANRSKMELLQQQYQFTYIYKEMPFNFSKMCNMGVARATGDLVLLMNDDIEIIERSWLRRMAGQALQPHVGAVGAKLLYAGTENIQHTGITNMQAGPSHKLIGLPDDRDYYYGRNRVSYNIAGVTAACLMVSREKYAEAGGMDEAIAISYNDVDFCFKLTEAGYYNVQRNDAVLYHHESLSRGLDEEDESKWERLLSEKSDLFAKHPQMEGQDAFYHKALIDNAIDYRCNYKSPYEDRSCTVKVESAPKELTKKVNKKRLRLEVEKVEIQPKIRTGDSDVLCITGWCYVPGADNALYDKRMLLRRVDGGDYTAVPFDRYREDVEAVFPMEHNIGLSGFVLRVLREDLGSGMYRIGMLCTNGRGDKLLAWSDKTCGI